jgi:hypothetical protein
MDDENKTLRVGVELRLTEDLSHGIEAIRVGFGLYDMSNGECVTTYDLPIGDPRPLLYEIGATGHTRSDGKGMHDIQNVHIVKYAASYYDLKKLMPVMKRLDAALDAWRSDGDYSFAGSIMALVGATKASQLHYRKVRGDCRTIKGGDILVETVRLVDAFVAQHGRRHYAA